MKISGFRRLSLLLAGLLLAAAMAQADPSEGESRRKMSPEERARMGQQMREEWGRLPPEERKARKEARREQWQRLSPEEREEMRNIHRQYHEDRQQLTPEERDRWREVMRRQHQRPPPQDPFPPSPP